MPAEWEPHAATWIAWPHFRGDWPGKFEPIPWVYVEIVRHLVGSERVEILVNDGAAETKVRKTLDRAGLPCANLRFHHQPTDRVWTRDSGCIFTKSSRADGRLQALTFRFTAWAKYSNYAKDAAVAPLMARVAKARAVRPMYGKQRIVLEGGAIDVNGVGTLLTTEECLLSKVQERNPGFLREDYERLFADYFGANNIIWLGDGIVGDDTHGHVDDLARFVAADTVVTMVEPDFADENHSALAENLGRLRSARDQNGKKLQIVELPMPRPVLFERHRLPASYANFYIANRVVLVPIFADPNDRIVLNTLGQLFPTREIVPIYSRDFIWGFGAMHCMTQQQPE